MAKETLIYIVSLDSIEDVELRKSIERLNKTDAELETFMDLAEEQGTVYSLPGFEQAFNTFSYPVVDCIMKIVEVEMAQ